MQQAQRIGGTVRGRLVGLVGALGVLGGAAALTLGLYSQRTPTQAEMVPAQVQVAPLRQETPSGQYPFGAHGFDALLPQSSRVPLVAPVQPASLSGQYPFGAHGFDALLPQAPSAPLVAPVAPSSLSGQYPFGAHGFDALLPQASRGPIRESSSSRSQIARSLLAN